MSGQLEEQIGKGARPKIRTRCGEEGAKVLVGSWRGSRIRATKAAGMCWLNKEGKQYRRLGEGGKED